METVVVLCRAETSLNVGAVCRVMANTDLDCLRIVGDKNIYNETQVLTLALHSKNIWERAEFFPATIEGLKAATSDCHCVFATTRRIGIKRKHQGLTPEDFAKLASRASNEKIAIVFGNERTGLTDEEVEVCSHSINIPASEKYGSYNLSHAVLIIAYTLFTAKRHLNDISDDTFSNTDKRSINAIQKSEKVPPLLKWKDKSMESRSLMTFAENCEVASEVVSKLKEMGLYKKGGDRDCELFLSQMLCNAKMSKEEGDFFKNIFTKLYYETKKATLQHHFML